MKKVLASLLVGLLAMGTLVGCGKTQVVKTEDKKVSKVEEKQADKQEKTQEDKVVKIFNLKVETAEQLEALTKDFEKTHPGVKLEVETAGGGVDYGAILKTKFASGNEPDIFINSGNNELNLWVEKLEDLSDQPWVENLNSGTAEGITKDGKIYGQPLNMEGYGFIYNKDLFAKAGIAQEPKSLEEIKALVNEYIPNVYEIVYHKNINFALFKGDIDVSIAIKTVEFTMDKLSETMLADFISPNEFKLDEYVDEIAKYLKLFRQTFYK